MKQRGQVLELTSPRTLLEHPAAVRADAVRGAIVVGVEQGPYAAEAGRLQIEHARSPWQRLDVGDRVDRLVPGDPLTVGLEQISRGGFEGRILDPRVR